MTGQINHPHTLKSSHWQTPYFSVLRSVASVDVFLEPAFAYLPQNMAPKPILVKRISNLYHFGEVQPTRSPTQSTYSLFFKRIEF